ncbi:hypothetical protein [Nostoc sphaeroides]|uniref:IS5 family transposase n=1 Tax=Nostoc sphaeroides CCNUC1 TaxID=2653204 RepID=A0A5P8WCL2_9NOSO|nr:hypothetical protein [Nostoc sphaeroides]MCC5633124.1 hypothetical protein [Nostoc sphaeroides CHAB 2801]QFS50553.1 IS5 family transposase [Nostoc sphaeroides CCNUC1]
MNQSNYAIRTETESLEDCGYQGISKLHTNSHLLQKKPKGGKLTQEQKQSNRDECESPSSD